MTPAQIEASKHVDRYNCDDIDDDIVNLARIRHAAANPRGGCFVPVEAAPGLTFLIGIIDEMAERIGTVEANECARRAAQAREPTDAIHFLAHGGGFSCENRTASRWTRRYERVTCPGCMTALGFTQEKGGGA